MCRSESYLADCKARWWSWEIVRAIYCRSDQSSTAPHVRGGGSRRGGREYNTRYLGLPAHYGLKPTVIGVAEPHENGDVKSAHGHWRTAIDQALRLRGSRYFGGRGPSPEALIFADVKWGNITRKERFRSRVRGIMAAGSHALARVR